ncbi:MAG: hypothetical protein NTZ55_05425 [Candidatus Roizmanbacteria bacterium]|nr:hypothetical protein [Candidatus Roizmanbacteria bacterium]
MTTIVNSPAPTNESGGSSFLIGIIIFIGFVLILLYYGLPVIKNMSVQTPQVNIPNKIDVNVKQTK